MKRKDDLTKIVCTIGPTCEKQEVMEALIKAGMDIARLNFSHGSHESHFQAIMNLRHAAYRTGKNLGIMADIQGPRIRISELSHKNVLVTELLFEAGERVLLKEKKPPKALPGYMEKHIRLDSEVPLLEHLKVGDRVYLDNGTVELLTKSRRFTGGWEMEVRNTEKIKTRKGINFPTLAQHIPSFTSKDRSDLAFALRQGLDYVALSFVKNAKDITNLRRRMEKIVGRNKGLPLIIAKIETVTALHNLKEILAVTDVIMVARGDLAVEAEQEKVPLYQKLMIRHCIKKGVPVIVATNMLESMTELPRPTRAELTDVANAVIDHADAVMLSGETASGKYPIRAVQTMSKIIKATEESRYDDDNRLPELEKRRTGGAENAIEMTAQTIYNLTKEGKPKAIIIKNAPVSFIIALSNLRPPAPVLCYLGNQDPWTRKLLVYFGVIPYPSENKFTRAKAKIVHYLEAEGSESKKGWEFKVATVNRTAPTA
jgi:pyruvate kinase